MTTERFFAVVVAFVLVTSAPATASPFARALAVLSLGAISPAEDGAAANALERAATAPRAPLAADRVRLEREKLG